MSERRTRPRPNNTQHPQTLGVNLPLPLAVDHLFSCSFPVFGKPWFPLKRLPAYEQGPAAVGDLHPRVEGEAVVVADVDGGGRDGGVA